MQEYFEKLINNITLTSKQKNDAKIKYRGVCKTIHKGFYDSEYNGSTKLLFGSYRKKTAIRPMTENQDVDVLFKIDEDIFRRYESKEDGQSALLQKVRSILMKSKKYSLGEKPKAWGKVILVSTADGCHNVELLPAFEKNDGSFVIPNTENGGSWDDFNPRIEMDNFKKSNKESDGITRCLIKMVKRWKQENKTLVLKSYIIDNYVINFLDGYSFANYPKLVFDFFNFLNLKDGNTFTEKAKNRAERAIKFLSENNKDGAISEYKRIFGDSFPIAIKNLADVKYDIAPNEQFIDEIFEVDMDHKISFGLIGKINNKNLGGFRKYLHQMSYLPKNMSIAFEVTNIKGISIDECIFKWKIRNFGENAKSNRQLRGEITDDGFMHKESSLYEGNHFVECYIIKNNKCVAIKKLNVLIK